MAAGRALIAPARHVEQAEPLFSEPVAALDTRAPPLAEVATGAELAQFVGVIADPGRKAEVVILRRDPPRARTGPDLAIFPNEDLRVRAVDLLGNQHLTAQARHLRKCHKVHIARRLRGRVVRGCGRRFSAEATTILLRHFLSPPFRQGGGVDGETVHDLWTYAITKVHKTWTAIPGRCGRLWTLGALMAQDEQPSPSDGVRNEGRGGERECRPNCQDQHAAGDVRQ